MTGCNRLTRARSTCYGAFPFICNKALVSSRCKFFPVYSVPVGRSVCAMDLLGMQMVSTLPQQKRARTCCGIYGFVL